MYFHMSKYVHSQYHSVIIMITYNVIAFQEDLLQFPSHLS